MPNAMNLSTLSPNTPLRKNHITLVNLKPLVASNRALTLNSERSFVDIGRSFGLGPPREGGGVISEEGSENTGRSVCSCVRGFKMRYQPWGPLSAHHDHLWHLTALRRSRGAFTLTARRTAGQFACIFRVRQSIGSKSNRTGSRGFRTLNFEVTLLGSIGRKQTGCVHASDSQRPVADKRGRPLAGAHPPTPSRPFPPQFRWLRRLHIPAFATTCEFAAPLSPSLHPIIIMIAHSQPIALPSASSSMLTLDGTPQDYAMLDAGSYTGSSSGTFNPASYTRHFLGSPISWRAGSFGLAGRFPAGSPTAQLLNSIDLNEYRSGKTPSSIESDSIMNALNVFDREGEFCRNYTCCGLLLHDLHALLEHFEEVHIVVLDPSSSQPQAHIQIPFNPTVHDLDPRTSQQPVPSQEQLQQHVQQQLQNRQQQQQQQLQQQSHYATPFDPDDMELDLDLDNHPLPPPPPPPSSAYSSARSSPSSCAPSPPDTPISTPLSAYPSPHAFLPQLPGHLSLGPYHSHSPYISQPPSPPSTYDPSTAASTRQSSPTLSQMGGGMPHAHTHAPSSGRPNLNLTLSSAGFPRATPAPASLNPEEAFNAYARFASDYSSCMPGAQFNPATVDEASALGGGGSGIAAWQLQQQQAVQAQGGGCMPPALLFASSTTGGGGMASPVSATSSRVPSPTHHHQTQRAAAQSSNSAPPSAHPSGAGAGSGLSKLSLSLSLAQPRSSTTPAPSPNSAAQTTSAAAALAARSSSNNSAAPPLLLSKPFRCPKPNCNKSYKQANGLKYHMTHGSCNFAPPKDLEHVKDLLERKRREREAQGQQGGVGGAGGSGSGLTRSASLGSSPSASAAVPTPGTSTSHASSPSTLHPSEPGTPLSPTSILSLTYSDLSNISEHDLREVEREAERRLRPFACGVGDCQRRYKNMNGLRYHYQHSGEHGEVGLALLASGQHECLGSNRRGAGGGAGGGNGGGVQRSNTASGVIGVGHGLGLGGGMGMKGSVSVPVSRAGSVPGSRVGTPQPQPQPPQPQAQLQHQFQQQFQHLQQLNHARAAAAAAAASSSSSATATATTTTTTTAITPTTAPVQAQVFVVPVANGNGRSTPASTSRNGSPTSLTSSPPGSASARGSPQQQQAQAQAQVQAQQQQQQQQQGYQQNAYQMAYAYAHAQHVQRYQAAQVQAAQAQQAQAAQQQQVQQQQQRQSPPQQPAQPQPHAQVPVQPQFGYGTAGYLGLGASATATANGVSVVGVGGISVLEGGVQGGQGERGEPDAAAAAALYARQQHAQNSEASFSFSYAQVGGMDMS
ncbi:unnamed protein product [Cyclocybe aegerita]|uniref:C2H2-type domain-containing protein n=1 Tax=Cyclocybe aegerita TaxID=1973307 RepID=A0A8S0XTQ0_CYCAE|nr:unnamed protein product [Cyclocybe aegerita]